MRQVGYCGVGALISLVVSLALLVGGSWFAWRGFTSVPKSAPVVRVQASPGQQATGEAGATGLRVDRVTGVACPPRDVLRSGSGDVGFDTDDTVLPAACAGGSARVDVGERPDGTVAMGPGMILIPAAGTYTRVSTEGPLGRVSESGSIMLPGAAYTTRWVGGAQVGDRSGTISVFGHVRWDGVRGALAGLEGLEAGNVAFVSGPDGTVEKYQLDRLYEHPRSERLPDGLFGVSGAKRLAVVTCGGPLEEGPDGRLHYRSNVIAEFVYVGDVPVF